MYIFFLSAPTVSDECDILLCALLARGVATPGDGQAGPEEVDDDEQTQLEDAQPIQGHGADRDDGNNGGPDMHNGKGLLVA
jgi:hypothetical protein